LDEISEGGNMSFSKVPLGDKAPSIVNAVIENPRGGHNKYEYDEELDEIMLDRVLHSPNFYPIDYGFIPGTRSEDGDHLDIMVLVSEPTFPGCVLDARPVGILDMEDEGGKDQKILAVAVKDPVYGKAQTIEDIDEHTRKSIAHFMETYKALEPDKWTKVGDWQGVDEAKSNIIGAKKRFEKEG
jgi:inorganic pyrophosphatase